MHLLLHIQVPDVLGAISEEEIFVGFLLLFDLLPQHILMGFVHRIQLLRVVLLTHHVLLIILLQCVASVVIIDRIVQLLVCLVCVGLRKILQGDLAAE